MNGIVLADFLRWFVAGLIGFMGVITLLGPRQFAAVCPHVPMRGLDDATAERVGDAGCRRKELENVSPAYGVGIGLAWLAFAACCALGVGTPALWYAAAFLTLSGVMAAVFLHVRSVAKKRIALLSTRSATEVVPWYWFAAAAVVAVAALAWSELREPGWPALLICAAALASAWLAWRIATMPALLSGDDVPAERYVDEHLRFGRATAVLLFAFVEVFVFVMFDIGRSGTFRGSAVLAWTTAFAWLAFSAWTIAAKLRPQRFALR
jgi:hypothetical protein